MREFLTTILVILSVMTVFSQGRGELESSLTKSFPNDSIIIADGRWVFNSETDSIIKIEKPIINRLISEFEFYEVMLTNYLGYHRERSSCLVLFDPTLKKIILVEPLWYTGIDTEFLKLFIGLSFDDQTALESFLWELADLMLVGSESKEFKNMVITDNLTSIDLIENRNSRGLWREFEIKLKDLQILKFRSTNPISKETITVK